MGTYYDAPYGVDHVRRVFLLGRVRVENGVVEMIIMGIDPGKNGAAVLMNVENNQDTWIFQASKYSPLDLVNALGEMRLGVDFCYIERVQAMPKDGRSSAFKFGTNFGTYLGILTALKIPFSYVSPGVWQRVMGCLSKGDKNVTKKKAQELFPKLTVTHATADALLIAEYGRRKDPIKFKQEYPPLPKVKAKKRNYMMSISFEEEAADL